MADQPATGGSTTTYQIATLTPGLGDVLLKDDSPDILQNQLWQFLNVDLSTANLTDVDFLNIMDMVDIAFSNFLNGIPEDKWGEFQVKETVYDVDPATKKLVPVQTKLYPITELWDAMRTKVYIKCCKARYGFLMRVLTEQRSSIKQEYDERRTMAGLPGMPGVPMPSQGEQKKGWGII